MSNLSLKIPPVAQGLIALVCIWLLSKYLPLFHIDIAFKGIASAVIIGSGVLVGGLAVASFIRLRTTVDPRYPEKAKMLVVVGIYRYSRNPMYLAIALVLFGISIYLGTLSSLLILFLFVFYINRFQIVTEEQVLKQIFGEQYVRYTNHVRRWI